MARLFSQRSVSRIAGRRPSRAEPDDPIFLPSRLPSPLFLFFSPLDSLPPLSPPSLRSANNKKHKYNKSTINQQTDQQIQKTKTATDQQSQIQRPSPSGPPRHDENHDFGPFRPPARHRPRTPIIVDFRTRPRTGSPEGPSGPGTGRQCYEGRIFQRRVGRHRQIERREGAGPAPIEIRRHRARGRQPHAAVTARILRTG